MSMLLVFYVAAGCVFGVGATFVITARWPEHPVLRDALAALDERSPRPATDTTADSGRSIRHVVVRLPCQWPGRVPDADLDVLGWSRDRFLLGRIGNAAALGACGPVLAATLALLDLDVSLAVPGGVVIVGAIVGWTSFGRRIEERAEGAREELRFALVSYLQQVSLLRYGGAGVATALALPARLINDSWAMRRIRDELDLAERSGLMPWDGLRRFGERIDLHDLDDVSAIAATAGHDGGTVVDTLLARAESLRDELLADEHAAANRASGQMSTPGALQVFLIAAWVLYPAGVALLST